MPSTKAPKHQSDIVMQLAEKETRRRRRSRSQQHAHRSTASTDDDKAALSSEEEEEEVTEFEVELDRHGHPVASSWSMQFYEYAADGNLLLLTRLLDDGKVEVNDVDTDGFTALMVAAAEGHASIVTFLLDRGADASIRTHELRSTALHFAAKSGNAVIVDAICKQDPQHVDCWNVNGDTPLIWACIEGRADAVRVLLEYHADVNAVNQYGATTLICAVMIGEDPEADDSDDDRAQILRMLLRKNPKLVNFQDREGSTAMHLAASCGYLECCKTLLELGADITLRNAIGQTPLEEAEQTGVTESGPCVEHLRQIWKHLEDEAAARMMSMLNEMDEQAGPSTSKAKKAKKKNKKAKKKPAKQSTAPAIQAPHGEKEKTTVQSANDDDGSDSSDDDGDDEDDKKAARPPLSQVVGKQPKDEEKQRALVEDDQVNDGIAWTTVGKKHHGHPRMPADEPAPPRPNQQQHERPPPLQIPDRQDDFHQSEQKSPKVMPFKNAKSSPTTHDLDSVAHSSTKEQTTPSTQSTIAASAGGEGNVQATAAAGVAPSIRQEQTPRSVTSLFDSASQAPFMIGHSISQPPVSSVPSFSGTSSIGAERTYRHVNMLSPWRSAGTSATASSSSSSSSSLPFTSPAASSSSSLSSRLLWKQQRFAPPKTLNSVAVEAKQRWLRHVVGDSDDTTKQESVYDALGYLACGLCGELVNDNVQCHHSHSLETNAPCLQLYCASCLAKAVMSAGLRGLACVKCRQPLQRERMVHNHFAQAQAASLGLSASSQNSSTDQLKTKTTNPKWTIDQMQAALEQRMPRASIVDLSASFMTPGRDLSSLSNGQLEILHLAHTIAIQEIQERLIDNARVTERMRIEEWMKTQRDILHFASQTKPSAS